MPRLNKILQPKSIAIIGASRKEGSLGKMFMEAVLRMNFKGEIYPVNPKADVIDGIKTYPSVSELPQKPDLAVILLSYQFVLPTVEALGKSGIRDIIVISAGFKEVGGEGLEREKELIKLGKTYDLNILGPNCMGIFNTREDISFNGTFSPTLPQPGHAAFISQSGALGVAVLELYAQSDLGFSVFVSTGNKADISDTDALEFLTDDANTQVVTLYMESIDQPTAFKEICRKTVAKKPVLAVKAGRTDSGHKAASSHTGALANPEHIVDGFLKQCGVIRIDTLEEMFDAARALALQPLPSGPRTAVITNAGGPGILASDAIERAGLQLAVFSASTIEKLTAVLPAEAAKTNPVDMIASANEETYKNALKIILQDEGVDSVLLIIVKPPVNSTPASIISGLKPLLQNTTKTVIPVLMANRDDTFGIDVLKRLKLPVFPYPESAVKTLAVMQRYKQIREQLRSEENSAPQKFYDSLPLNSAPGSNQADIKTIFDLFEQYEIPTAPYRVSTRLEDILQFQKESAGSVVLKTANAQIIHKSDEGLLQLNLNDAAAVSEAFQSIASKVQSLLPAGETPLFLVQRQLPKGAELVLGGKRDEQFGPVVMAGFGGIMVEVLKDVIFRIAPLSPAEALEMLNELKAQAFFNGFRGQPAVSREKFAETISRFSRLLHDHPEISEMDLNPLIWNEEAGAAVVVDARATVKL